MKMSVKKNTAIQNMRKDVEIMSELILGQLRELDNLLTSGELCMESEKKKKFRETEKTIDEYEIKISDEFINIISLHKPVASELRMVIACYRLSINLERIGDMALKILRILLEIKQHPNIKDFIDEISNMLTLTNNMVEKSILSLFNNDIEYAIWTLKNDDIIDEINKKMIKKIIKKNRGQLSDSQTLSNFINIKIIVSNIERMADQATNIAEASIYYLKGEDIRHSDITSVESELEKPSSDKNE